MKKGCDYLAEIPGFPKSFGKTLRWGCGVGAQGGKIVGELKAEERKGRAQQEEKNPGIM